MNPLLMLMIHTTQNEQKKLLQISCIFKLDINTTVEIAITHVKNQDHIQNITHTTHT